MALPDFHIHSSGRISTEFANRNISTFSRAALFVRQLPYGRNPDKNNLVSVFSDQCGTCSTKHALLKQLADENHFTGLKLMVGLFRMNAENTPEIAAVLRRNNLEYIPEAHCYLRYEDLVLDYTRPHSKPSDFMDCLLEEIEILPGQIADFKVNYHKAYLANWLTSTGQTPLTLNDLWNIREQCIQRIADKS